MKEELKCRRLEVNLNRMEVAALVDFLYRGCTAAQAKCAKGAVKKIADAWEQTEKKGGEK